MGAPESLGRAWGMFERQADMPWCLLWQVSDKNTNDDDEDYALPIWAGRVPLKLVPGTPEPDPRLDPAYADAIPDYILPYRRPTEVA